MTIWSKELRSEVTAEGIVKLFLIDALVPNPDNDQVVIRIEASPINPSDLGLLFAGADVSRASVTDSDDGPLVTAPLPPGALRSLSARVDLSMPVGNEGAGTVVATGSSEQARRLMGKIVSAAGGGMYAQYRCVNASSCLELPEGTTARQGASSFVNPLTALGMLETMRRDGHLGIVHTAAASNLGQMLNRLCLQEKVPLVNIVRRKEHEALLYSNGARYVCNSNSPTFVSGLVTAIGETSATLAFDAIGGGTVASDILFAMEAATLESSNSSYSRYGSTRHKQLYIYGALDQNPTTLTRRYGFAWGVGAWLLTPFLQTLSPQRVEALRAYVAENVTTTFASTYSHEVSLSAMLQPESFEAFAKMSTGDKYLLVPSS